MEKKTDWRKFRKSTHLASPDLDIMVSEGKELIFTIKEVKHEKGVNVSGQKTDGFFCYFKENVKPLKIINTNLKTLSKFARQNGVDSTDVFMVENYAGLKIELYVDHNVKFMGDLVDGIRIRSVQPVIKKPILTEKHKNWSKAKEAVKNKTATLESLNKNYVVTKEIFEILCS